MNEFGCIDLFGGLGLFILGMQLLADGLQKAAGERMRRILELFTSGRSQLFDRSSRHRFCSRVDYDCDDCGLSTQD